MKNDLQILEIVLLFLKEQGFIQFGLCNFSKVLSNNRIITRGEHERFKQILMVHKPQGALLLSYFFPKGEYEVRVKFLENIINELK